MGAAARAEAVDADSPPPSALAGGSGSRRSGPSAVYAATDRARASSRSSSGAATGFGSSRWVLRCRAAGGLCPTPRVPDCRYGDEMLIMSDGAVDGTDESVSFWRDNRSAFGEFVEAWGYLSDDDALRDGRRFTNSTRGDLASPVQPKLVLIDEHGNELWLTACCVGYGGGGPGGTETILVEEGFGSQAYLWKMISNHLVLGLRKGVDEPLEAVPVSVRGSKRDRYQLDRWLNRLWYEPRIHTPADLRRAARWLKKKDPLEWPAGVGFARGKPKRT